MKKAFGKLQYTSRLAVFLLALLLLAPQALAAPAQPTVEITHTGDGDRIAVETTAKAEPPDGDSEYRVEMDLTIQVAAGLTIDPASVQAVYKSEDGETNALSKAEWDVDPQEGLMVVSLAVDTDMGGQIVCQFNCDLSAESKLTNTARFDVTYQDLETGNETTQSASDRDEIQPPAPKPKGYSLTLDLNGGSLTGKDSPFLWQDGLSQGQKVNLSDLPAPARSGYFFDGWTVASGAGAKVDNGVLTMGDANVTLRAVWTSKEDKLTLDLNGGSGKLVTVAGTTGEDVTLPYPSEVLYSRAGYKLAGWSTTPDGQSGKTYTGGETFTLTRGEDVLYAWWAPQYTLSYDGNGGAGQMPRRVFSANEKAVISENAFKRTGYDFTGWCLSADGRGTLYQSGDSIELTGDTTLYAQWEMVQETPAEPQGGGGSHLPLLLGILAAVVIVGGVCGFLIWRNRRNDDGPYDDDYDDRDGYDDYDGRDEYDDGYDDRYDTRRQADYDRRRSGGYGRDRYDGERDRYDRRRDGYRDRPDRYDDRGRRRYDDRYDD